MPNTPKPDQGGKKPDHDKNHPDHKPGGQHKPDDTKKAQPAKR